MGLKESADVVTKTCMDIKKGENAVVITDNATLNIGWALYDSASEITDEAQIVILDELGSRPLPKFPDKLQSLVKDVDVSVLAAKSMPGELISVRRPWLNMIKERKKRHGHMPNITHDEFITGLMVDYEKNAELTQNVHETLKDARQLRITTRLGTDLTITLNPNYKMLIDNGLYRGKPGDKIWGNIPAGEVFTTPENVEGVAIIDGCFGDGFDTIYGNVARTPVKLDIEKSRIKTVASNHSSLEQSLKRYFAQHPNANQIGEIGIGTNLGFAVANWEHVNMLAGEKDARYVHIAAGNGYADETGAPAERFDAPCHIDGTISGADLIAITAEGKEKVIKINGEFVDEMLK